MTQADMTDPMRDAMEADSTLYLERFAVRKILIGQLDEHLHITEGILADVDELPIFTKADLTLAPHHEAPASSRVGEETWSATKHNEIIKRLMEQVGLPNSTSLYTAFKQFANELHSLATSRPDAGGGVRVKPLEWIDREGAETFDASTPVGHYIATITATGRGAWFIVGLTQSNYTMADIANVKAAAQADYEQRILSALSTPPAAVESNGSAEARLREAVDVARRALVVLRVRLNTEPTVQGRSWIDLGIMLNNAVDKADKALLATGDEAKKSEGGVEGHARSTKADSVRGEAGSAPSKDGSLAKLAAGIKPGPSEPTADVKSLRDYAREFSEGGMRCNCDLDNWEPERSTGHSHVCRIHKAATDAFTVGRR